MWRAYIEEDSDGKGKEVIMVFREVAIYIETAGFSDLDGYATCWFTPSNKTQAHFFRSLFCPRQT
jgi:hypothetical protein